MKFLSENFSDLHQLYVHQLRVLLSAEEQIVRAMPNLVVRATDEQLRQALQSHLQETEVHIQRLESLLKDEKNTDPKVDSTSPLKCHAIAALTGEAEDLIQDSRDAWVRDAGIIVAAQCVEHYEIASYGAVRNWAEVMGHQRAVELLDATLKEEGHADHLLTSISTRINPYATRTAA